MRLPLPQLTDRERHPAHIAEVIETATTEFLAQCLEPEDLSFPAMPPFGSWVKSFDEEASNQIYGVVYYATTSPIDSVHRARALGMTLEDLRQQQPQIFAMLKTEFRVAIAGFETSEGRYYQHLPPKRPPICSTLLVSHISNGLLNDVASKKQFNRRNDKKVTNNRLA